MPSKQSYAIVLIRIPNRGHLEEKEQEQERIHELLNQPKIAQFLLSPYSRNIKSEFQGIFESGTGLIRHLFLIRDALYPIKPQFSIGIGTVDNTINKVAAVVIEGAGIKNAELGFKSLQEESTALQINGFTRSIDALMHPLCDLLWHSTDNWNQNRLKILNAKLEGASEKVIHTTLSISERAVYKSIRDAHLMTWIALINELEANITKALLQNRQID